jgi:group I intron endonuclease
MTKPCVYSIKSSFDNRLYIGSAISFEERKYEHLKLLRKGKHHSRKLQHFYSKHGEESLVFSVIDFCIEHDLLWLEQYWIDFFDASGKGGFNICPTAGSSLGRKHSDITRDKIRKKAIGRKQSKEQIEARVKKNTGKKRSEEAIKATLLATSKLTMEEANEVRECLRSGMIQMEVAKMFGVCQRTISRIHQGLSYKEKSLFD